MRAEMRGHMKPLALLVVAVALVGGCSAAHKGSSESVVPKGSTSPTTRSSVPPEGPACPARVPPARPKAAGLSTALVPFVATGVRICRYLVVENSSAVHLAGSAKAGTAAIVASLEREMNAFAVVRPQDLSVPCPATGPPMSFLTFYGTASSVDVVEEGGCGRLTNGLRVVTATPSWRAEMAEWTKCDGCRPEALVTVDG
jgi:hypothetical protein